MGFFSSDEMSSLSLSKMVLHVVGKKPFIEQKEMNPADNQADFFSARIADVARDAVHQFVIKSPTKALLTEMASGQTTFEAGAQELSRRFSSNHVGGSRDGAFFIFELVCSDSQTKFYCMIKYDYSEAIELYDKAGNNALRQIIQAFVKSRKSIQKFFVCRVNSGKIENDVSAYDRMGNQPDLTDYFLSFLDVTRNRNNNELNRALVSVLRATLMDNASILPSGGVPVAFAVTKDVLRSRQTVDEEAIREAIWVASGRPEEEEARKKLDKALEKGLKEVKLQGLVFKPDPGVLRRSPRRFIKTHEDVFIEFPGELEGTVVKSQKQPNGGTLITISTAKSLVEDGIVAFKNR